VNTTGDAESVLRSLRGLVPQQRTTFLEALRVAELQAERLLVLLDIPAPPVPIGIITQIANIDVRLDSDLPASGSAHWESGRWIITLKSSDAMSRRRFSLMHELKHVLDHPARNALYGDTINDPIAAYRAERGADQFAACVLMPERWIKREWFVAGQRLQEVAARFGVSPRALSVRLWLLGMAPEVKRWASMPRPSVDEPDPTRYFRALSDLEIAS
jgi:Zn-dependent peptidase ImmA (M78 family)